MGDQFFFLFFCSSFYSILCNRFYSIFCSVFCISISHRISRCFLREISIFLFENSSLFCSSFFGILPGAFLIGFFRVFFIRVLAAFEVLS